MDLSILRAVPHVVARVMGKWLIAFSVAGLRLAAGNFNIMIDEERKRAKYASRNGDRCLGRCTAPRGYWHSPRRQENT